MRSVFTRVLANPGWLSQRFLTFIFIFLFFFTSFYYFYLFNYCPIPPEASEFSFYLTSVYTRLNIIEGSVLFLLLLCVFIFSLLAYLLRLFVTLLILASHITLSSLSLFLHNSQSPLLYTIQCAALSFCFPFSYLRPRLPRHFLFYFILFHFYQLGILLYPM